MIIVSIVIPVFNDASSLRKCLSDLKLVVTREIQVVVIDDGSTDQSPMVAAEFSEEFDNFTFESLVENKGVGSARNLGLKLSLGVYVYFLDCDDTVTGDFATSLMSELSANSDLVFAPIIKLPSGSSNELYLSFLKQGQISGRDHLMSSFEKFDSWPQECWGYYIRRKFLSDNRIEFRNIRIAEDIVFMTEVFCKAETFSVLSSPTYIHHRVAGSLGKSFSHYEVASWFNAFLGMVKIAEQFSSESIEGRLIADRTATVLTYFLIDIRANDVSAQRVFFEDFKDVIYFQQLCGLAGIKPDQSTDLETVLSELLNHCSNNVQKLRSSVGAGKTYLYCYDRLSLGVFRIMRALNYAVDGLIDDNIDYLIPSSEIETMPLTSNTLGGQLPQDSTFVVCHDKHSVYLAKKKQFKDLEEEGLRIVKFSTKDFVAGLHFENLFKQNF